MFTPALVFLLLKKLFLKTNLYAFVIIFTIFESLS